MASDSWGLFTSGGSSRRQQLQFDLQLGYDEIMDMEDDDSNLEFMCPFCSDDFDEVELCCHIHDDHPVEVKTGVCPVCTVGGFMDLVGHLIVQHGKFISIRRRKKFHRGSAGSHSSLSLLKRELREGHMQSLLGGSACTFPPTSCVPDPLLSSFIYNLPSADSVKDVEPVQVEEDSLSCNSLDHDAAESIPQPSLSDKDQKERAQRSEFVHSMLWSTIFPHDL